MSNVFDESEDLKNARSFVAFMRSEYQRQLHDQKTDGLDPSTIRLRNQMVTHWPGDEIMQQIVKDVAQIMRNNNIKPEDIR